MIDNQSVRNRLRNHLNVQLTESKVVQTEPYAISVSRIKINEQLSNSDMSIIHELGILDKSTNNFDENQSNGYFFNNILNRQRQNLNQKRPFHQQRDIAKSLKSKIKTYRQQLQANNQYQSIHRENQFKFLQASSKYHSRDFFYQQNRGHHAQNVSEQNGTADIQERISNLPFVLQQKIKENLHKKANLPRQSLFQAEMQNQRESGIYPAQYQSHLMRNQNTYPIVNFITPHQEKFFEEDNTNKQKFVSLNRPTFSKIKSISKSIIFHQKPFLSQKLSTPQLNLNQDRKNEYQAQKNMLNSALLKRQIKGSSKDEQVPKSRSKGRLMQNSDMMSTRKKQMEELYHKARGEVPGNQQSQKQNLLKIQEQFNRSKVIRNYTQVLNALPKCKKCTSSVGALTLFKDDVIYACNQCDLKNGLDRSVSFLASSNAFNDQDFGLKWGIQRQAVNYNHPIIGALFDLQNKLMNESQMKTYNALLKQISIQMTKLQQMKTKMLKLEVQIQNLKHKLRSNSKLIFQSKSALKNLFNDQNKSEVNSKQQLNLKFIHQIVPSQYLKELDIWCKLKAENFTQWPHINQKLQLLCPLYMKDNIDTIKQFLNPLLHNFQNNDVKISVSEGLKLPVKSLGSVTFLIDGSYNISSFQKIQKLTLQFINKRTFRQITSMMQNLPQIIDQITLKYNHKLNSHISAQKYPILTKMASIRTCKKLYAQIQNCKDQDDLLSAMRVMSKKKQLRIVTTRSIYVRKPLTQATTQIKEMLKRIGNNTILIDLNLSVSFDEANIYRQLMLNERNKLMQFSIRSTVSSEQENKNNYSSLNFNTEKDNSMGDLSVFKEMDLKSQKKKTPDQNPKDKYICQSRRSFQNKIRRKLQALALLKQSYFLKYKQLQNGNLKQLPKSSAEMYKIQSSHQFRLQVLKMLL